VTFDPDTTHGFSSIPYDEMLESPPGQRRFRVNWADRMTFMEDLMGSSVQQEDGSWMTTIKFYKNGTDIWFPRNATFEGVGPPKKDEKELAIAYLYAIVTITFTKIVATEVGTRLGWSP
jgi:hypothetical protein